jgi:hypothetical protein
MIKLTSVLVFSARVNDKKVTHKKMYQYISLSQRHLQDTEIFKKG